MLEQILSLEQLETALSVPYPETVEMMKRLKGDIIILGAGGKMGPTLAATAFNACQEAGVKKRIIAVARFSDPISKERMEAIGIETIACDLLDESAVQSLPDVENVLFLAGRKFGEVGSEAANLDD